MALNIKDPETERLAAEIAALTGETKTRAVKVALLERKNRLAAEAGTVPRRTERLRKYLETEVWPNLPPEVRGKRVSKDEWEEILGYGPHGV
jgi:antitoxin VapB